MADLCLKLNFCFFSLLAGSRRGLRSSRPTRASVNGRQLRSVQNKRRPSAATVIAKQIKQKRRITTLTAASKSKDLQSLSKSARMLQRLTPRGTKPAAFVKKAKKMPLEGKSLRGRNVSLSSDEEEEEEEMEQNPQGIGKSNFSSKFYH